MNQSEQNIRNANNEETEKETVVPEETEYIATSEFNKAFNIGAGKYDEASQKIFEALRKNAENRFVEYEKMLAYYQNELDKLKGGIMENEPSSKRQPKVERNNFGTIVKGISGIEDNIKKQTGILDNLFKLSKSKEDKKEDKRNAKKPDAPIEKPVGIWEKIIIPIIAWLLIVVMLILIAKLLAKYFWNFNLFEYFLKIVKWR